MTTLLPPSLPPLLPGQKRHANALLADPWATLPAPAGEILTQVIAVHEVCRPDECYANESLDHLTFFLTLQGRTKVQVDAGGFTHQPGALAVVASGCRLVEQVAPDQPWHVYYFQIIGPWADQMDIWLRRQDPAMIFCPAVSTRRRQVFMEMTDLALTQPDGWAWLFLSRCADLLGGLYSEALSASPGDALVAQVARLLDAAPGERPTPAQMASLLGMTPRQLLYRFGKAAGEPLAQWVRKRRVAAARRLLSQSQSVSSVAEQLGYANPYHFSRVFKAVTGTSPSAVRGSALTAGLHVREEAP